MLFLSVALFKKQNFSPANFFVPTCLHPCQLKLTLDKFPCHLGTENTPYYELAQWKVHTLVHLEITAYSYNIKPS